MKLKNILNEVLLLIKDAADAVMEVYSKDFTVEYKADLSPLSEADVAAHQVITASLAKFGWPIISEENDISLAYTDSPEYFWLVDPLDGTKEFISKNGEFTINIALIKNSQPILGIVAIPAQHKIYYAVAGEGAFCLDEKNKLKQIFCSKQGNIQDATIAVSRSHLKEDDKNFITKNKISKVLPLGSALKYCYIADGTVDLSIRYTPLMSWDIAASDIILRESGAKLVDFDGNEYSYDYKTIEQAINCGLIASNSLVI